MENKKLEKAIDKIGIIMFAFIAFAFTIAGALAGSEWTVTLEHANNTYTNDAAMTADFRYINDDFNYTHLYNSSNMSLFTQSDGTWKNNATFTSTNQIQNNSINGSVVNFTIMPTADRVVVFQAVVWNQSGSRIATSENYTITYDTTEPTVPFTNVPAYEKVTVTYTPRDEVSASNCSVDSGSYSSVSNNTAYTYTKSYSNQGDYSISVTCYDRAGNVNTTSTAFSIHFAAAPAPVTYDAYGNVIPQTTEQQQAYQQQIQRPAQQPAQAPSVSIDTQKVNTFWQGIVSFFRKLFGG